MALDIKISFSWINYCRLCLQDKGLKIPIFDTEGVTENISVKIQECLNIRTYDGDPLPRMICHQCLCKLNTAYELHLKAVESFRLLLTHLQPLKHVPSVQEYMKDCHVSAGSDESKEEAPVEPLAKPSATRSKSGQFCKAINHETAEDCEEALESGLGRVTRSRFNSRSSVGSQDGGTASQKGSITIVPDIENPSFTSSTTEAAPSAPPSKEPVFLVPLPPKPRVDNHVYADNTEHDSNEDISKRKRKRITDYYDEALMHTGGNLVLAAGRTRESRHRDSKRKKIGPASRTRALATCLSGPSPWQCVMCACFFASHNMLRRHLSNCLICQTCGLEFSSAKDKALHEQDHMYVNMNKYVDLLYKCNQCERAFSAHLMLKQHTKYDHPENSEHLYSDFTQPSPYIDPDSGEDDLNGEDGDSCKCESDEEKKTNEANNVDEKTIEKKEVCPKCSRPFVNKQRLMYHLLGHENLIKCSFCPWMFPMGPGRRRHMRNLHGDKGDPVCFTCSVCKETFETKSILYLHKKGHGKDVDDPGKSEGPSKKGELEHCHVCDKMIQPSKFMNHLMHHANDAYDGKQQVEESPKEPDTQLQCQLCPVVSSTPEQHRAHVAQKHVQQKTINFTCDGCSQTFANVEAINRHSCPGKETEKQWQNCEHCGQNVSEGISHVCDNKCPICHKIFKSSRGQRLHLQHKHENPESVPVNVDSSDTRSSDAGEAPEVGAFENVAVKEEKDTEEVSEETSETSLLCDESEKPTECSKPSEEQVEEQPSTTSHAVSDEPSSSTSPNLPTGTPLPRQNTVSHPDKSSNGKGTPKIRLKPSESLISEPPPLCALTKLQPAAPNDQGYTTKPPPPYRPPMGSTETKFTKSIILRKNAGSVQSYSMVVSNVGNSSNSMTPMPEAGKNAPNPRSDHSYTSNLTPPLMAPALPTTFQPSTLSPVVGTPVSSVADVSPSFVTTVGRPVFIPSSSSSQVVSTKFVSTSVATRTTRPARPTMSLSLPATPSVIINTMTEHCENRPTLPAPTHVIKETQPVVSPANQSHNIRCVQISSLQGLPTSSPATFLSVSNNPAPILLTNQSSVATFSQMSSNQSNSATYSPVSSNQSHVATFSQLSTNQSNVGLGYSSNMYNRVPRVPNPLFAHFQPASGAGSTEENLLRDVLLGRRLRDEDPV